MGFGLGRLFLPSIAILPIFLLAVVHGRIPRLGDLARAI